MAIDTHVHIFDEAFNEDREEVIKRIVEANIKKVVVVGFSKETNILALELAKKHDFIYPTAGYHPSEANEIVESDINDLEEFITSNKVYAIGECGLDYYWVSDNKEKHSFTMREVILIDEIDPYVLKGFLNDRKELSITELAIIYIFSKYQKYVNITEYKHINFNDSSLNDKIIYICNIDRSYILIVGDEDIIIDPKIKILYCEKMEEAISFIAKKVREV
jgi:hypothetical protein